MLDVVLVGPRALVLDERIHEGHDLAHAASVGSGEGPQIVACGRKRLADRAHHIEIEEAVAVGLRAREFQRQAAIGGHLVRHQASS